VANTEDIINLVINPPIYTHATGSAKEKIKVHTSIQIALTLETIWNFRNQVVHNDAKLDLYTTIKALENRILEHVDATTLMDTVENKTKSFWEKPPSGTIKLNTDAAIRGNYATLAVVARDNHGKILLAATKKVHIRDSMVAEALALLWDLNLVVYYQFQHCIIEGDAKTCIDACKGRLDDCPWSISAICHDIKSLLRSFPSVVFNWVIKDTNSMAHTLAKFVAQSQFFSFCNINSLPPSEYEVYLRDVSGSA
jgi:ribonuclease HI